MLSQSLKGSHNNIMCILDDAMQGLPMSHKKHVHAILFEKTYNHRVKYIPNINIHMQCTRAFEALCILKKVYFSLMLFIMGANAHLSNNVLAIANIIDTSYHDILKNVNQLEDRHHVLIYTVLSNIACR